MNSVSEETLSHRWKTSPNKLILVGALLGLLLALGLSVLRVALTEASPQRVEEGLGSVAFGLIYLSPYLIALYAVHRLQPSSRAPLLLAATILSLAASVLAFSGVSLVFLPATILLGIATVRAYRSPNQGARRSMALSLAAFAAAVVVGSAFTILFIHQDPRCWEFTQYADGETVWRSVAVPESGIGAAGLLGPPPEEAISQATHCTSDIVTPVEALEGMGVLATGLLVLLGIGRHNERNLPAMN